MIEYQFAGKRVFYREYGAGAEIVQSDGTVVADFKSHIDAEKFLEMLVAADIQASNSVRYFRWAYRLLTALAIRCKNDNGSMHELQCWGGLAGSSRSMYLTKARSEAGIDCDEFSYVVRNEIDCADIYDEFALK
jgi:hypothetical protein